MSYFIISDQKPNDKNIPTLRIKHEDDTRYLFNTTDNSFNNKNY